MSPAKLLSYGMKIIDEGALALALFCLLLGFLTTWNASKWLKDGDGDHAEGDPLGYAGSGRRYRRFNTHPER